MLDLFAASHSVRTVVARARHGTQRRRSVGVSEECLAMHEGLRERSVCACVRARVYVCVCAQACISGRMFGGRQRREQVLQSAIFVAVCFD